MNRRTHTIHERFLRHIWSKQYLTSGLQTAEGKTLEVFDVGRANTDGGPDFCNAKIKINGITYSGDVEIHRTVFDWLQHQHQEDPRYNQVILHVVLEATSSIPPTLVNSGRQVPILVLGRFLSDSIQTIWQKAILDERARKLETIPCFDTNGSLTPEALDHWLSKLAVERLELKLRRFDERLKQLAYEHRMTLHEWQWPYGVLPFEGEHDEIPLPFPELTQNDFSPKELWEQLLYEGMMEGLGYAKNRKPFLRLAENLTLKQFARWGSALSLTIIESLLFGTACLLPKRKGLHEKEAREYVSLLQKQWKDVRSHYHGEVLHPADWQFFPTRPSNFPTIRLAAAGMLVKSLLEHDMFRRIIQSLKTNDPAAAKERLLIQIFSIGRRTISGSITTASTRRHRPLLRLLALLGYAILSLMLFCPSRYYMRVFLKTKLSGKVRWISITLSPAQRTILLHVTMEAQLLKKRYGMKSIDRQQAVIQLYMYYCREGRCSDCELGILLSCSP